MFDKVLKEIELGIIDLRFNKKSDIGAKSDIDIAVIRLIEEASIKLATARELNIISSSYVKKEVIEEVKVKKETVKTFKKTIEIEEKSTSLQEVVVTGKTAEISEKMDKKTFSLPVVHLG